MTRRPQVVLFSGSRNWSDRDLVRLDLEGLPPGSLVIEGGARGLDAIVRTEARKLGIHVATVPALWSYYKGAGAKGGNPAGYLRNEAMAKLKPDFLLAYPLGASPGTRSMMAIAERDGIQVREP
jgi:hypothetical protein